LRALPIAPPLTQQMVPAKNQKNFDEVSGGLGEKKLPSMRNTSRPDAAWWSGVGEVISALCNINSQ
jgi:hypothetical protein